MRKVAERHEAWMTPNEKMKMKNMTINSYLEKLTKY